MSAQLSFKLARRHARAAAARLVLSVVALTLGVALVVAVQIMNGSVVNAFLNAIDDMAGRAALTVSAPGGAPFKLGELKAQLAVDGVDQVVPVVTGVAFPDDGSGELLTVHAVDLSDQPAVEVYHRGDTRSIIADKSNFFLRLDSVILAREYAQQRGLTIGSSFSVITPKGVRRLTVRGLLEPQGLARTLGGRLLVMDIYAAQDMFTAPDFVTRLDLVLKDNDRAADVSRAIAARLPEGLTVEEASIRRDVTRRAFRAFEAMLTAFSFLIVIVGFVICYSRLGVIFETRTWEIGLVRAVGLTRGEVFLELLKESLLLGALGTAIGIPLGIVVARFALPIVTVATTLQYHLPLLATEITVPAVAVVLGLMVGIGAAVLAAAAPALRLARTEPVAALTLRGRETGSAVAPVRWQILGVLAAAIAGLIVAQWLSGLVVLGHVTTVLIAATACLAARPVVDSGGRLLGSVWQAIFGTLGLLAARRLREQGRRASLTVATLALGLGVVLMFAMLVRSFEASLMAQVTARLKADLVVTARSVSGGWMNAPVDQGVREDIGKLPGVLSTAGEQRRDALLRGQNVVLDGYDPECFHNSRLCEWPLEGGALPNAVARVAAGQAVLVSSPLARVLGVRVGDVLEVMSPHGLQRLPVAGVTNSEPEPAIILSRERYRQAWNDGHVTWIHVATDDPSTVAAAIEANVGSKEWLLVRTGQGLIQFFGEQVRKGFQFLYPMEAITLLLVLISIGDTLASSVLDRMRELAMMRAVGLQRSRLFAMMMLEGATIGILGCGLAVAFGLALGLFWVHLQLPALLGWTLDLYVPYRPVLAGALAALLLCLIGALLPSLRAAYVSVPAGLRNE